jgi:penicillin-binding protein 2
VVGIKKNEKYDAKKVGERMRDHALYTAFAPADNPKIAIAIVVENGGFGAESAAPIVRKALDYYLLGKRPEVKDKPPAGTVEAANGPTVKVTTSAAAPTPKTNAATQGTDD